MRTRWLESLIITLGLTSLGFVGCKGDDDGPADENGDGDGDSSSESAESTMTGDGDTTTTGDGGDLVRSFDSVSKIPGPSCRLGDFIPYTRG
jgi:hypothetical protein